VWIEKGGEQGTPQSILPVLGKIAGIYLAALVPLLLLDF
jgi:hypothetical protein